MGKNQYPSTLNFCFQLNICIWNYWFKDVETKKATPLLWQIFKTILFTVTMVFKSVVENSLLKLGYCGTEGISTCFFSLYHPSILMTCISIEKALILSTFSHLYFITSRFGLYGFSTFKTVFFTILDQLMENPKTCNRIVKTFKPPIGDRPAQKSKMVFYLLVTEQVMKVLDDEMVEKDVLPLLYPYP